MRTLLYIATAALFAVSLTLSGGVVAQEQAFFANVPDLPLMPGLTENAEESVIFDQPDGRIVEAGATGETLTAAGVLAFYSRILPQLGWRGGGPWSREGESLSLIAQDVPGGVAVTLRLAPR